MTLSEKYPSLNGLRAFSILLVLIHHVNIREHMFDGITRHIWIKPVTDFLRDGQLGVTVFFVISGFLITSLMMREENSGGFSLKNFYIRRILRIFPAYLFLLSFYFLLQISGAVQISNASWLNSLTYTKYLNPSLDWITAHAWSLSIEENFYLFWPLVFLGGMKVRKSIAWSLVVAVPFVRTVSFFYPVSWVHELSLFTRIDAIAVGCLFAMYKEEILSRLANHGTRVFYVCVFFLVFLRYGQVAADYFNLGFIFIPFGLSHGSFACVLIGIIMMYSVFGHKGKWFAFLNSRIMNYLGILSYSIYLWQQIFFSGMNYWVLNFPQNILFIFLAAIFSYYGIERPFLKLKILFSKEFKSGEISVKKIEGAI